MEKKKIQGVIFDMDGLLVDTEKLYNRFWREAAHDYGYEMTYEDALSIRSMTAVYASALLKKRFDAAFPYDEIKEHRRVIMQKYIDEQGIELKKGARELLQYLKENDYKTALATASPLRRAQRYLQNVLPSAKNQVRHQSGRAFLRHQTLATRTKFCPLA